MNILILGGSQFVGRHIVDALLAARHTVTILNRGRSSDDLPACVERLSGDRDEGPAGLNALAERTWDACVDVSGYTPRQVRASAERLERRVGRYVFVSAVSVYGDPERGPVTESFPRMQPASEDVTEIDSKTYGPLKVTCEDLVQQIYGRKSTLLRPQIVAGPWDPYDRFSYWARRAEQPGEMLAPGDGSDHLQFVDARDLARFTLTAIENGLDGSFNISGTRLTWRDFIALLGARDVVWVSATTIKDAGVTEFELPLYRPNGGARSSLMNVSHERALSAGLTLTSPEVTLRDTRVWLQNSSLSPALSSILESRLINMERDRAPRGL